MDNIKKISQAYFLELIRSALLEKTPEMPPKEVNFKYIFDMAKYHDVVAICAESIGKLGENVPEIARVNFDKANKKAMLIEAVQKVELDSICVALKENSIEYMPLKGSVIKNYYPLPHMRHMSDLDILVKKSDVKRADEILKNLGYILKVQANKEHIFQKPPHMNVELHWKLMDEHKSKKMEKYFGNGWKRAVKNEEYSYKFSNEDFFIYTVGHLAMHFFANGIGIRAFLDIWVYLKHFSDKLDFGYLSSEMKECGIYDFYQNARDFVYFIIEEKEATPLLEEMLDFVMQSGSIGTLETSNLAEAGKGKSISNQKRRLIFARIFPNMTRMKKAYPILTKLPFLLPFCWIIRIFAGFFIRRREIKKNFNDVKNYDEEKIENLMDFYKRCGL